MQADLYNGHKILACTGWITTFCVVRYTLLFYVHKIRVSRFRVQLS